jgi:TonB family protein
MLLITAAFGLSASTACTVEFSVGSEAKEAAPRQDSASTAASPGVPTPPPAQLVSPHAALALPPQQPTAEPVQQKQPADVAAKPAVGAPTGVLSEKSLRKTAGRHRNELKFCIEQDPSNPKSPSMRVQFLVTPTGSVEAVEVLDRTNMSDRSAMCFVQAVKRWTFEAPKGGSARATLQLTP